jgi:hypothetical protein
VSLTAIIIILRADLFEASFGSEEFWRNKECSINKRREENASKNQFICIDGTYRDFPQQFRSFEIRRNSDNTISIITTNVDPVVAVGSPAAKSRGHAIGAARIFSGFVVV